MAKWKRLDEMPESLMDGRVIRIAWIPNGIVEHSTVASWRSSAWRDPFKDEGGFYTEFTHWDYTPRRTE